MCRCTGRDVRREKEIRGRGRGKVEGRRYGQRERGREGGREGGGRERGREGGKDDGGGMNSHQRFSEDMGNKEQSFGNVVFCFDLFCFSFLVAFSKRTTCVSCNT